MAPEDKKKKETPAGPEIMPGPKVGIARKGPRPGGLVGPDGAPLPSVQAIEAPKASEAPDEKALDEAETEKTTLLAQTLIWAWRNPDLRWIMQGNSFTSQGGPPGVVMQSLYSPGSLAVDSLFAFVVRAGGRMLTWRGGENTLPAEFYMNLYEQTLCAALAAEREAGPSAVALLQQVWARLKTENAELAEQAEKNVAHAAHAAGNGDAGASL